MPFSSDEESQIASAQQLFVRNLVGQSVSVIVDLDGDVCELADALAEREPCLWNALRFVFGGRQLEPKQPLREYGISKGSNIHLTSVLRSHPKTQWVRLRLKIVTPFAEADALLEVPERRSTESMFSRRMLRALHRVSNSLGVVSTPDPGEARRQHCAPGEDVESLRLHLGELRTFPCLRPHGAADIWHRLRTVPARMVLCGGGSGLIIISDNDKLPFELLHCDRAPALHLSVSLLNAKEQLVDDVTESFEEEDAWQRPGEACCICLEPMSIGQMLRRLSCLHRLHAGCAMSVLPNTRSCPLCRCCIVGGCRSPCDPNESDEDSGAETRLRRAVRMRPGSLQARPPGSIPAQSTSEI